MKFETSPTDEPIERAPSPEGPRVEAEQKEQREKEGFDVKFYVTDHNLRFDERVSPERQRTLYAEMKKHGITSIRFDADWKYLLPEKGAASKQEMIDRYAEAMKLMDEAGLEPPTIVVSNPPEWADKLYKSGDKEGYFGAYGEYLSAVADVMKASGGEVHSAQLWNEINNGNLFYFVDAEDLPRCVAMAREKLGAVHPDIKLSTSLIVGNLSDNIPERMRVKDRPPLDEFLERYEPILKEFDSISLDYYPGVWHQPLKEAGWSPKDTYKQLGKLKDVCERLSAWDKDYEIGEVGFPTIAGSTEKRQRYFYDSFFRAFRQMLIDFRSRDIKLPDRVGLFETEDEANTSFGGVAEKVLNANIVKKVIGAVNPEHHWGLMKEGGRAPKEILTGRRHKPQEEVIGLHLNDPEEISQLSRIIQYVNRPVAPEEKPV